MVNYENIYPGISYTTRLPTSYSPPISGYQAAASHLGMSLDARTANQLGDLNVKLNPGEKVVEIQGVQTRTMESIPNQHLDEIRRLTKLVGVKPTLHGPMVEASGIAGQQGYSEENRIGIERQIESAVLRAHQLDPKGNIPVTFHSTAELPEMKPHTMEEGEDGKSKRVEQGIWVVNEGTGQFQLLRPEKRYFPEGGEFSGKPIPFNSTKEIERANEESWSRNITELNYYANMGENSIKGLQETLPPEVYNQLGKLDTAQIKDKEDRERYEQWMRQVGHGQTYLRNSYRMMKQLFDTAYKNVDEKERIEMETFAEKAKKVVEQKGIETDVSRIEQLRNVVDEGIKTLSNLKPKIFKPLNDFVINKSAETFGNVATKAYSEFGETAPIISIENPPGGGGISTADDMVRLIQASRAQMAKNLVDNKKFSQSEANTIAEKMIGATWDVGHINMMRKKGYTEEDIVGETKKIAKFVKHVHLSDNFGLDHTELPMGMGNVPLKKMMDEIKKAGFKGEQMVEAGNWWEFFSTQGGGNPFIPSLEGMNSPLYAMHNAPTWAQGGRYGAYYMGHGAVNPAVHHSL